MATKPSVQIDWINDDAASKYTVPSGAEQLAGFVDGNNADAKVFNWAWWRVSQWIEFLDNNFDANGLINTAVNSTVIAGTITPAASTVGIDSGGIKSWDGSSNAIFSVTEAGAVTIGYAANNTISLSGGALTVGAATAADLIKLNGITSSAAEINRLDSTSGMYITTGNTAAAGVYINDTNATYTALMVNDSGGHGLQIVNTATNYNGIQIDDCGGHAIEINSAYDGSNTDAIHIDTSGGTDYCRNGVFINGPSTNGVYITGQGLHGIYIVDSGSSSTDAIYVADSQRYGVHVVDADSHAMYVGGSGGAGVYITGTTSSGVAINSPGSDGVSIVSATAVGVYVNGATNAFEVNACTGDGLKVTSAGAHGIEIVACTSNGITITEPGDHGISIADSGDSTHDSIYIADSQRHGINIADADYNGILVTTSGDSAIYVANAGSYGLNIGQVSSPYGQIFMNPVGTIPTSLYTSATGGALCVYNNSGTAELWFNDGVTGATGWVKIA